MENLQRHTVSGLRHICDLLGAPESEDDTPVAEMVSHGNDNRDGYVKWGVAGDEVLVPSGLQFCRLVRIEFTVPFQMTREHPLLPFCSWYAAACTVVYTASKAICCSSAASHGAENKGGYLIFPASCFPSAFGVCRCTSWSLFLILWWTRRIAQRRNEGTRRAVGQQGRGLDTGLQIAPVTEAANSAWRSVSHGQQRSRPPCSSSFLQRWP